jgi:hypothetical protein
MKKLYLLQLLIIISIPFQELLSQSVGIGTNTPNASAQLDISSTTSGLLIPRMTQAERDLIAPVQGLMIFNTTTNSFQYHNGSAWANMAHSGIISGTPNKIPKFLGLWGLTPGLMTDNGAGIAINTNSANPDASAMMDIQSTTKGLLIPRMTTAERNAIASPFKGLLVFDNTSSSFWFYNGGAWSEIGGGGGNSWSMNGNDIYNNNSGNVGIGTSIPAARLSVDSSIMVDQANSNQGFLDRSSLYFGDDKKVGIVRSFLAGSSGRNGLGFFTNNTRRMTIDSTGQVGIGTINPLQTLHVNGTTYLSGNVGIGSSTPDYAFENLLGYNYMFYGLGVGTTPNSTYLLDVGASGTGARFRGDVRIDGLLNPTTTLNVGSNATVEGTLTVNGGKGVAYNSGSATNLRIAPFTTANFHAVLGPHASAETTIALPAGFTSTPRVFVGSIRSTGGTTGELNRVILVLWGCDTNSCNAKIINTDNASVDYNITWDCMAIGN